MADGLQFDDALHEYRLEGRRLPSVTEVLGPITAHEYRAVDRETMERAALLGKCVHKLIELDIAGTLDVETLDDSLRPYLAQWRQFLAQSGFLAIHSECRVHSARYGYAGTLDLAGTLNGARAVVDAKRTAAVPRSAGPQTAAYRAALAELYDGEWQTADRYALHLTPERWRLVPQKDPNDLRVFLSALTLHNYLEQSK
ncbi:MAG TPA: hypothetical protein VN662_08760 [Rhodanobacteraceae bacterium]|nr:hypothetical protein [Rhodanobacteraceae bacterium]